MRSRRSCAFVTSAWAPTGAKGRSECPERAPAQHKSARVRIPPRRLSGEQHARASLSSPAARLGWRHLRRHLSTPRGLPCPPQPALLPRRPDGSGCVRQGTVASGRGAPVGRLGAPLRPGVRRWVACGCWLVPVLSSVAAQCRGAGSVEGGVRLWLGSMVGAYGRSGRVSKRSGCLLEALRGVSRNSGA
jgi:hypothetical protein